MPKSKLTQEEKKEQKRTYLSMEAKQSKLPKGMEGQKFGKNKGLLVQ